MCPVNLWFCVLSWTWYCPLSSHLDQHSKLQPLSGSPAASSEASQKKCWKLEEGRVSLSSQVKVTIVTTHKWYAQEIKGTRPFCKEEQEDMRENKSNAEESDDVVVCLATLCNKGYIKKQSSGAGRALAGPHPYKQASFLSKEHLVTSP